MRTLSRALPAALGAVALTVALTGCNGSDSDSGKSGKDRSGSSSSAGSDSSSGSDEGEGDTADKTSFALGEASPPQQSEDTKSKGATYTVMPTKVETGTKADLDNSGLKKDKGDGPQVPVYVWSTLTHESGKPMALGDMDDDLVVRTDQDKRTRALIVLLGEAKWPDCPKFDRDKELNPGDSEKICTVFLIDEGQKAAAVELMRGFTKPPLEWPVKN